MLFSIVATALMIPLFAGRCLAANDTAAAGNATAAASNATAAGGDAQTSLTLDPTVIAKGFAQDGQATPEAGQVASLTSTNNFINFCKGKTLTDGKQVTGGSCNPAVMGDIPATTAMPSAKFVFPGNFQNIAENTAFTIKMAIANMETGNFVNAQANYFAAPQQLNAQGQIKGHSHVVIEQITGFNLVTPLDPTKFAFFKGLNAAAAGGILTADVTAGLGAGTYRLASINTAANHQPCLVPVAQHGSLDDITYFSVGADGLKQAIATVPPEAAADVGGAAAANGTATAAPAASASASTKPKRRRSRPSRL